MKSFLKSCLQQLMLQMFGLSSFSRKWRFKMCLENLNKQIKHLFLSRHCLAIIYLDNQQVFIPSKALYYPFIGKLYFGGTNLLWEKSSMEQKEVNTNTTLKWTMLPSTCNLHHIALKIGGKLSLAHLKYCQARFQVQGLSQISNKRPGPGACSYNCNATHHHHHPENFSEQNNIEISSCMNTLIIWHP